MFRILTKRIVVALMTSRSYFLIFSVPKVCNYLLLFPRLILPVVYMSATLVFNLHLTRSSKSAYVRIDRRPNRVMVSIK